MPYGYAANVSDRTNANWNWMALRAYKGPESGPSVVVPGSARGLAGGGGYVPSAGLLMSAGSGGSFLPDYKALEARHWGGRWLEPPHWGSGRGGNWLDSLRKLAPTREALGQTSMGRAIQHDTGGNRFHTMAQGRGFEAGMRAADNRHWGNQTSRWKGGVPAAIRGTTYAGNSPAFVSIAQYPGRSLATLAPSLTQLRCIQRGGWPDDRSRAARG
jgi:hypothetical protein